MARPLYRTDRKPPAPRDAGGNAGLWFDKFCDTWRVERRRWSMSADAGGHNPKLVWLRRVGGGGPVGAQGQIDEAALRLARLVHRRGGRIAVFETESRFVTGLGRSHPVENGFAWHPTLGTPYLPGSSIKGLVRSWAREEVEPRPERKTVARLFGEPGRVGSVCFLDALPTTPVRLDVDVMTPHYAGWSEEDPPGDWCAPNPIPFLVTAVGTPFLFGIVPRPGLHGDLLDIVMRWLGDALGWAGAGARTAVGYGRFRGDDQKTDGWRRRLEEEQARREATGSPEGRWRLEIRGCSEGELLERVRIHLVKEPLTDPVERAAFVAAVRATGLVDCWRRGETRDKQTRVGKKKLKERARLLDEASGESI